MNKILLELLDDPPGGTLELLLLWLDGDEGTGSVEDVQPLITWLQSEQDEARLDQFLSRSLMTHLICVSELRQWLMSSDECDCSGIQLEWLNCVERVSRCIPGQGGDWYQAAGDLCQEHDPFLSAILGAALEPLTDVFNLPVKVQQLVTSVRCGSQHRYERLPVPPAVGRSSMVADYVHRSRDETLYDALGPLVTTLTVWDEQTLERFASPPDTMVAPGKIDIDAVHIGCDDLTELSREFLNGWPVERKRLKQPLALLQKVFADNQENNDEESKAIGVLLHQAAGALEISTKPAGETDSQDIGSPVPSTCCEPSNITASLEELAACLKSRSVAEPSHCCTTLTDLISSTNYDRENLANEMLDLLVELNKELCESTSNQSGTLALRNRIHNILVEQLSFRVLGDDDLVGKPIEDVRDWVTIHSSYEFPSLPANYIISVRQPGYLFRLGNGDTSLVRPAEVNVSR